VPSKARVAFNKNAEDIERLLEIHATIGGDAKGRRYQLEVLNKSAVVLVTAIWEAYCEDIAAEALDHIIANVPNASALPKELMKRIARDIKAEPNELAMWDLADGGWKTRVKNRLAALTAERNRRLNTPRSENIDQLFSSAIGLLSVSESWSWTNMPTQTAKDKLDKYVSLRGAIAHRGKGGASVKKVNVEEYFEHVKRLVRKTGGKVNSFVRKVTGKSLWARLTKA